MRKFPAFLIMILMAGLFLGACSSPQNPNQPQAENTAYPVTSDSSYPMPEVYSPYPDPGYPAPENNLPTPIPTNTPTPDPAKGVVKGQLLLNNQPVPNTILYLAGVIRDQEGREMVAAFDPAKSPNVTTDQNGNFTFVNIPPARYGLILYVVTNSILLSKPNEEIEMLFSVEANKDTDLGPLNYDYLPLPPP